MDLISSIPLVGPFLAVVLPFLVVLSVVVAIHELGHLLVGRWCGIKAEVYSIGFGKVLWSRVDRRGTRWQVAALPLGGYVKFLGDMDPASAGRVDDSEIPEEDRRKAFHNAALWRRALAVVAGPVANFLLSIIVFAGLALHSGKISDEPVIDILSDDAPAEIGFQPGDRVLRIGDHQTETFSDVLTRLLETNGTPTPVEVIRDGGNVTFTTVYTHTPLIENVTPGGSAIRAGVRPGDMLVSIDGKLMHSAREVQITIAELEPGKEITFGLEREGEQLDIAFVPDLELRKHPVTGDETEIPLMGIMLPHLQHFAPPIESLSILEATRYGVKQVWKIIGDTVTVLNQMIFRGADTSNLSGPIGIAKFSGAAAEDGLTSFIKLIAFLSTAIGLFNLFPIPILDGGHLMFYAAEAVRGRPVGETSMRYGTMVGLSLVLLLMVFVTYNDLMRL